LWHLRHNTGYRTRNFDLKLVHRAVTCDWGAYAFDTRVKDRRGAAARVMKN